jgi:hypothetical protein
MPKIQKLSPAHRAALQPFISAWNASPRDLREGLTFDEWVQKTSTHLLKPKQVVWVTHHLAGGVFRGQS